MPNPVPWRIIVARHEHIPVLASRPRTPNSGRPSPHHLRVMSTLIPPRTGVAVVAIIAPLPDPRIRRLARLPRLPVAPEDILPVWTSGVLQPTVTVGFSLQRPPSRVARKVPVPLQRRQTQLSARRVLGLQESEHFGTGKGLRSCGGKGTHSEDDKKQNQMHMAGRHCVDKISTATRSLAS